MNINGYETFYLGSQNDIVNSLKIDLVLYTDLSITLNNFKSIWAGLNNHSIHEIINNSEGILKYIINAGKNSIVLFNVIFYLNQFNELIGCTIFDNILSTQLNSYSFADILYINIKLNLTDFKLSEIDLSFKVNESENFFSTPLGDELYQYTSKKKINNYLKNESDNYIRYSNIVDSIVSDLSFGILTDNLFILNNKYSKCKLFDYLYSSSDTKVFTTYYDKKPCIFILRDNGSYKMISIVDVNVFNKPVTLFSGILLIDLKNYSDYYVAGKYLVLNTRYLIDLETREELNSFKEDVYVDPLNLEELEILSISSIKEKTNIVLTQGSYTLYRKQGPWCMYINTLNNSIYWVSSFGSLLSHRYENIYLVNDRVFISLGEGIGKDEKTKDFTTLYCVTPKETIKTNEYFEKSLSKTKLDFIDNSPRKIYTGSLSSSKYYNSNIFTYINEAGMKHCPILDGFRHNPLIDYNIKPIVGCIGGIVLINDNNKMSCL